MRDGVDRIMENGPYDISEEFDALAKEYDDNTLRVVVGDWERNGEICRV